LKPGYVLALGNRGRAHLQLGEPALAAADFTEVLAHDPADVQARLGLAIAYGVQGQHAQAVSEADTAVRGAPDSAEALNIRCWALGLAGESLDRALADCDRSVALKADAPEVYDARGFVRLRKGDAELALADYAAALRLRPQLATARFGQGLAELRLGREAAGRSDMATAQAAQPQVAAAFAKYGLTP
ncbi:MAG TPA: tetratricopeptide repeat protein, partial [Phenylobacterium sp.]|nr:tetratricopeptide repeat protein [Phenylobacterium sp.]